MEKRHDRGITKAGVSGYRFSRNFDSNHGKKAHDPYRPMPIEINIIKKRTMQRKPNKGANKKALKCYGYNKPGHFARDCRSKNVVLRPQINIIKRVPIKKEGTPEDGKPSPV